MKQINVYLDHVSSALDQSSSTGSICEQILSDFSFKFSQVLNSTGNKSSFTQYFSFLVDFHVFQDSSGWISVQGSIDF